MNVHTPKKKKTFKQKLQKGCKGAISILLCLLMTPFISIALGLVEYSRYQSMMELTEELYELTGISLMSDYDSYLHDRFGLLATNQSGSLGDSADSYMQTNKLILGKQIEVGGVGAKGKLALSNEDILRQQVIDVSELTATTAVIADDFKLQDLLNKLKGVSQFTSLMNTMDGMADLCDALDDAVDALENLEAVLKKLQTAVNNAKSSATTLATNLSNFYKKMYEKGASLASSANQNAIDAAMALITQEDLDELIGLYKDTKNLMGNVESIKTNLGSVKRYVGEFKDAVKAAADAAEKLTTSNSMDEDGKLSEVAKRKETILSTIEEQGKLTPELKKRIAASWDATELEDIYLPYKPNRKTRAEVARQRGLEPLANLLMLQREVNLDERVKPFIKGEVTSADEALKGARDIIAERVNEDERARNQVRNLFGRTATITSKVIKGKEEEGQKFRDYFEFSEPLKRCTSHRLLALRRGEAEGILKVSISPDDDECRGCCGCGDREE